MIRLDIVIPVRNEAANIPPFVERVRALGLPADVRWRLLFIEDGSSDATVEVLRTCSQNEPRIVYFSTANGFGEGPAMMFGISRSNADAIVMMGADGSDPVDVIPQMVEEFRAGAKVVQCTRRSLTGRPWYRDVGTAGFHLLLRLLTGRRVEEQNIYYRLISRSYAQEILKMPRFWRYVRFPLPDRDSGALVTIDVEMEERTLGESTYTWGRLLLLALDGVVTFMSPQRLATLVACSGVLALGILWFGNTVLSALALAPALLLSIRFIWLARADYIEKLIVAESSLTRGQGPSEDETGL